MKRNKLTQSSQQKTISSFFKVAESVKPPTNSNSDCLLSEGKSVKSIEAVDKSSLTPRKRKLVAQKNEQSPGKRRNVTKVDPRDCRRSPRKHAGSLSTRKENSSAKPVDEVDRRPVEELNEIKSDFFNGEVGKKPLGKNPFEDSLDTIFLDSFVTPEKKKTILKDKTNRSPCKASSNSLMHKSLARKTRSSPGKNIIVEESQHLKLDDEPPRKTQSSLHKNIDLEESQILKLDEVNELDDELTKNPRNTRSSPRKNVDLEEAQILKLLEENELDDEPQRKTRNSPLKRIDLKSDEVNKTDDEPPRKTRSSSHKTIDLDESQFLKLDELNQLDDEPARKTRSSPRKKIDFKSDDVHKIDDEPARKTQSSPRKKIDLKTDDVNKIDEDPSEDFTEISSCFNDSFENDYLDSLFDLSTLTRCKVSEITYNSEGIPVLMLKCLQDSSNGSCKLQFPWSGLRIAIGDVLSVKAVKDGDGGWTAESSESIVVQHSDVLISGTAVVGSLFCRRRSVINHLFKESVGSSGQATAMFVGTVVHELLQQTLMKKLNTKKDIEALYRGVISSKEFIKKMFLENIDPASILESISSYLPRIVEFIQNYVSPSNSSQKTGTWPGEISEIRDIEENIWSPSLGIKGKIDATVQVKIHSKKKIMPLELKTGKASFSPEHRGQVILYTMMLSQLGIDSDSGLLLYLKEGQMKEIFSGGAEKRDLIMLRNQLASSIMETSEMGPTLASPPSLPPVINHHSACSKCPQLPLCSLFIRKEGGLSDENPLSKLAPETTAHLSEAHVDYIFTWLNLLLIEANQTRTSQPIWALSIKARDEGGTCLVDLVVSAPVEWKGPRCFVSLSPAKKTPIKQGVVSVSQFVIVSTDSQIAVSMGTVSAVQPNKVDLLLDRDISKMKGPFFIDRYESNSSITITAGFLSLLLEDSEKASSLRNHIIDLQLPTFSKKLSSRIKSRGKSVFDKLNKEQVRALLQVLSADGYLLIKGMPGTGKTRTLTGMVELLVLLDKSVIVTSHTHSAVDNILLGLPKNVTPKVMRLGGGRRVHPDLQHLTEDAIVERANCSSVDDLNKLYDSKSVIGVTCLGGGHRAIGRKKFDYCIVDEATQVCQPEILATIFQAEKFVLIGDPKQLPPLVINPKAKEGGMGVSLLERLDRPAVTTFLSLQYRMNSVITSLANSFTYGGLLKCANDAVASATICLQKKKKLTGWLRKVLSENIADSVVLVDAKADKDGKDQQTINQREADIVLEIAKLLKEEGISGGEIGVISPYRGQVLFLESKLNQVHSNIEVNTVDQYQGRDKSIIIYSATKSTPMRGADILSDTNRLTVAITRAKHKLIILGDVDILSTYPNFKKLLSFIDPANIVKHASLS